MNKKEIFRLLEKWANLTQEKLDKIKYFDDLLKIINEHGITMTIEK